ncbi:hypothetical protein [Actinoplanes regularis]|uniref:Uncharacterized protein n=1 Tax=Actinoplanes regularis TaxID=52697 RepID=A0A239B0A1_9ACTN|nr:hypothetical protein [Actinoplanes regularis]SNS00668.1 hypothetical protein SAMN06264365_108211 [Actinoplanes regularis]
MNARTSLVLAAAAAAFAVAGCSSTSTTAAPTTAAAATPTTAAATAEASATPVASEATSAVKPAAADKGCPVSEATLLKAFRGSDTAKALLPTETLSDIVCYQDYAIARTNPKSDIERPHVVYHFTGGAWKVLDGGTGDYCKTGVPADVRSHLHC